MATRYDSNRPVPAAIDGRRWTVSDSPHGGGGTDTKKADMYAPLTDTPTARMIRNHELIHARITPQVNAGDAAKKHGVTVDALQWSEDYRVGRLQSRLGLVPFDAFTGEEAAAFAKNVSRSARLVAGALLATASTPYQRDRISAALLAGGYDSDDLAEIQRGVQEILGLVYVRPRRGRKQKRFTKLAFAKLTVPLARLFDARWPVDAPPGGESMTEEARQANKRVQRIPHGGRLWGVVEKIVALPFTRRVRPRRPIGRRFSDAGVIPSAVHRLPVDGAIFGIRRRARGGTILCDASGSMHYSDRDIERIITEAPAATIAFYSGTRGPSGPAGRIVIAAASGRAASIDQVRDALQGGQNFIDGPALRWLAKQPGPRWWVSDEEVGGAGGDFGRGGMCWTECRSICLAGGIKIAATIDQVR